MKTTICMIASTLLFVSTGASLALASALVNFGTIPSSGSITGQPGTTIGWGYTITNEDTALWASADAINTSVAFSNGIFDTNNFDFPVLAPEQSVTEAFDPNTSGLAELTWNASASSSAQNSGVFELSLSWYTEDPNLCDFTCTYTGAAEALATTPFAATTSVSPEPTTSSLILCSLLMLGVESKRRRRRP